jgi:S1-C subfamily serine protease
MRNLLPLFDVLIVSLALCRAAGQPPTSEGSVLLVGIYIVQPTRLPVSFDNFGTQTVFLPVAYGTGFVVREDGYVVTARHVITRAESRLGEIHAAFKWMAVCSEGLNGSYDCKRVNVVATDDRTDLAVLKIMQPKAKSLPTLQLTSQQPSPGTEVWVAGYSRGRLSVRSGRFLGASGFPAEIAPEVRLRLWLVALTVTNGTSGGPIYLRDGSVIGVVVARSDKGPVAGFVPARHVTDLLARCGITLNSVNQAN